MADKDARLQIQRVLDDADRPVDAVAETPLEVNPPPDRTKQFTYTRFSRMKTSWVGDDAVQLGEIHYRTDLAIKGQFGRALRLIDQLMEIARVPEGHDAAGEVLKHPNGATRWQLDEHGDPVEDWSRLTSKQRSDFLHIIVIHLHEWETIRDLMWGDAMYAKVMWELQFAKGFLTLPGQAISGKPTIDDRTQTGHAFSGQERFFGVFQAVLSRRADSLVKSIIRIQWLLENASKG